MVFRGVCDIYGDGDDGVGCGVGGANIVLAHVNVTEYDV